MLTFKRYIAEAKSLTPAKALELFLFGGCLSFALALQKKIGGELYTISREGKDFHAFVRTSSGDFDVKGKRGKFSMIRDFSSHLDKWEIKGPLDAKDIPFKNNPALITKAEQYINDNPSLFKDK
jgi:hypothetical protein